MWATIVTAISAFFKSIPNILDYLTLGKLLKKDKTDKEEREQDMKNAEESNKNIENIVEDGKIDDINKKFGWKE